MSYVTVTCRFVPEFAYETNHIMEQTWIAILAMLNANKMIIKNGIFGSDRIQVAFTLVFYQYCV